MNKVRWEGEVMKDEKKRGREREAGGNFQ